MPVQRRNEEEVAMKNVPELFGSMVFNDQVMRTHLPKSVYETL